MFNDDQTGVNDLATALLSTLTTQPSPKVTGRWFPIRIKPNLATGELFNVGVGLIINGKTHVKLIQSAEPFKQLYGKDGDDNFSLLLDMIIWHFRHRLPKSKIPSPHIIFERSTFAAGDSVDEILNRLYQQMVTLRLLSDKPTQTRHNYNTERIRSMVRKQLNEANPDFVMRYWHNQALVLPNTDNISANLQIFIPQKLDRESVFSSIISVDYTESSVINSQFSSSFYELAITSSAISNGIGQLLIYRPPAISGETAEITDSAIDRAHYNLKKHTPKTSLEVRDNPAKIADDIMALAH